MGNTQLQADPTSPNGTFIHTCDTKHDPVHYGTGVVLPRTPPDSLNSVLSVHPHATQACGAVGMGKPNVEAQRPYDYLSTNAATP
jgi:hypothetical protein